MENITLGDIQNIVLGIAGMITSGGIIAGFVYKQFQKSLKKFKRTIKKFAKRVLREKVLSIFLFNYN